MEILLWLVPAVVATLAAMAWVSWAGRGSRGEIDRDVAVQRLGKALGKDLPAGTRRTAAPARDRSTGIAVRPRTASTPEGDRTRHAS